MKKIALFLLSYIVLASCSHKGNLSGCWVSERYINAVVNDTPVRNAQTMGRALWFNKRIKDTVLYIFNFHEGIDVVLHQTATGYEFNSSFMNAKDTLAKIKMISTDRMSIGKDMFIRLPGDTGIRGEPAVLEYLLFKGKYTSADNKEIEFTADGQVKGIDTINYYYPYIDYMDEGLNVDELSMGRDIKHQTTYGFRFHKDTLTIFKADCKVWDTTNHCCAVVEYGPAIYKLIKKK